MTRWGCGEWGSWHLHHGQQHCQSPVHALALQFSPAERGPPLYCWALLPPVPTGACGGRAVDAASLALQDVLSTVLYDVAGAFGEGLGKVVAESRGPVQPAAASRAEAEALLERLLSSEI